MTVCIAAICSEKKENESNYAIVTASDTKVTVGGYYSGEMVSLKSATLNPQWNIMLSGKISQRFPVLMELSRSLFKEKDYHGSEVASMCTDAFIKYQRQLAYEKVLSPFGLDVESFLKKRREIGPSLYERLWNEISNITAGFDMLVFGFEGLTNARIFIVSNPTVENPSFITFCDDAHFACIGTGAYLAESSLYAMEQYVGDSLGTTIYNVLCAKFLSESASDVGEVTYLRVFRPDGSIERMDNEFINKTVRKHWKKYNKPHIKSVTMKFLDNFKGHFKQVRPGKVADGKK